MNRREFIKNMAIAAGGVAGAAILGGSVLPPLQASIIDRGTLFGMPAVNVSFILPFICFVVIVLYAVFVFKQTKNTPPKVTEAEAN